jgi:hypothetical protein
LLRSLIDVIFFISPKESIDGYASGGSLCFSQKNMKPFLAKYFHHYIPQQLGRNKIPPHIKVCL